MIAGAHRESAWCRAPVFLAIAVLAAWPVMAGQIHDVEPRKPAIGRLEVETAAGETAPLTQMLPDAPTIIHFWATWCAPCREELPGVARFAAHLSENGLTDRLFVLSVDRKPTDRVVDFLHRELALEDLTTHRDRSENAGPIFALVGMPATVLLDGDRRVVKVSDGALDWDAPSVRDQLLDHIGLAE